MYFEDLIKSTSKTIDEKIDKILFFRANTFITKYWEEIKNLNIYKMIYIDDLHNSREIYELRILDRNFFDYFNLILYMLIVSINFLNM